MSERPVPVTLGSPRFRVENAGACLITLAWFPPGAVLEPHVHERPTLATMVEGAFDVDFTSAAIRRSRLTCAAGTSFTEPAGEKHANYVSTAGASVVVLQPDLAAAALPARCAAVFDRVHHMQNGAMMLAARRLSRELAAPDDLTTLAAQGLALEMFAEAARLEGEGGRPPRWLQQVLELVHDRFREPITIPEIAAAADVHPGHVATVFKRFQRVPLATYIRRLRVEWAADRLVTSDDAVSTIAAQAGFADQAHLTRAFKRMHGYTPAAYRRQTRH